MEGSFFGLTTFAQIRAQLGASTEELGNDYLENLSLAKELKLDLMMWFPKYQALADDEGEDAATVSQKISLELYAKVFCSHTCIPSIRMRFLQKKVDGEAQGTRFQHKDSINDLEQDLSKKLADLKATVLSFETDHTPSVEVATVAVLGMAVSTPSTDIIVG